MQNLLKKALLARVILPAALALVGGLAATQVAAPDAIAADTNAAPAAPGTSAPVVAPAAKKKAKKKKKGKRVRKAKGKAKGKTKGKRAHKGTRKALRRHGRKAAHAKKPVAKKTAAQPLVAPAPTPVTQVPAPLATKGLAAKPLDDAGTSSEEDNKVLDANDEDNSGSYLLIFGLFLAATAGAFLHLKRRNERAAAALTGFGGDPAATMSGTTVNGDTGMGAAASSGMSMLGLGGTNATGQNFSIVNPTATDSHVYHQPVAASDGPIHLSSNAAPLSQQPVPATGGAQGLAGNQRTAPMPQQVNSAVPSQLQGTTRDSGGDPCTFERFVEVQIAQTVWAEKGLDIPANLKRHFNITMLEWSKINVYWNQKYLADDRLLRQFHSLGTVFKAKYGGSAAS